MNQPDKMTLQGTLERRESDQKSKAVRRSLANAFSIPARWSLLLCIILSPWAFGSVQYWAQLVMAVGLLIGLAFWWFDTAMNTRDRQVIPYIFLLVAGGILIGLLQMIVLPERIAELIVGRQQEIYQDFFGGQSGISITLDREGTWGQIRLLTLALSGLLLGGRYFRSSRDTVLLLGVCAANGVLLSFVGILQKLTFNDRLLWIFEFGAGTPFGPFVNRNNGAGYLLMCLACCLGLIPIVMANRKNHGPRQMVSREIPIWRQLNYHLLYFISELTATKLTVLISAALIGSGIVASLSRGGVLALLVGAILTTIIYGVARKPKNLGFLLMPIVLLVLVLSGWIGFSDQLIQRFSKVDVVELNNDGRIQHWLDTYPAIEDMGLLGGGLGSYGGVHRFYRSDREDAMFEFAENQFFQSAVEAGWLGLILFLGAWGMAMGYAAILLFRGQSATSIGVGTFGVFLVTSQAVASFFDFGLYIAANAFLMAVLVGFLGYHAHAFAGRLRKKTWIRFQVPNSVVQVLLLLVFAGVSVVVLDLFRRSRIDGVLSPSPQSFTYTRLDLEETDRRIDYLEPKVRQCPSVDAINYLGELWIHRARLQFMSVLKADDGFKNAIAVMDEDETIELEKNVWNMTSLQRIQGNYFFLKRDVSLYQARRFINSPFLTENLPIAAGYFRYSKKRSPLQPTVLLRLGQIAGALGEDEAGSAEIERAIALAPQNPDYRMIGGIYYLQNGDVGAAGPHFRKYLELLPNNLSNAMKLFRGQTGRRLELVTNEQIIEQIMPDNSAMLYELATKWLVDDPENRRRALERADELLGEGLPSRNPLILLRADIRLALDDREGAIEAMEDALTNNPLDEETRYRVAKLLLENRKLEQAEEHAGFLWRSYQKPAYNRLLQRIKSEIEKRKFGDR